MKYWNKARIKRVRERKMRHEERRYARAQAGYLEQEHALRTYSPGNPIKNSNLMFDAMGLPLRRSMVLRLQRGGAMSLSKLAEPYRITLPAALKHVRLLEGASILTTHKKGRVRMCVYNPAALRELAAYLASRNV